MAKTSSLESKREDREIHVDLSCWVDQVNLTSMGAKRLFQLHNEQSFALSHIQ